MKLFLVLFISMMAMSCSHHTYYVVRHAEKSTAANMSSDVPLSEEGKKRAEEIKTLLQNKKIDEVFATNTIRAKTTGQPTADHFGKAINIYGPRPDSAFIQLIKSRKKNILIVGHSNTIDDIANGLAGEKKVPGDLADDQYNWLYVIKVKGNKYSFSAQQIYQ